MTLPKNEAGAVRPNCQALCYLLAAVFILVLTSFHVVAAEIRQEYFVRQEADEALLIRISAYEAEVEASVFAPEQRLLLSSAMPQSRLVPVFQFIEATSKPRQLELAVASSLSTANSKFEIEFTRLAAWDNRSADLERAYSLLSFGMQLITADNAADWTVKINSLMSAGSTFSQYGMSELRLWTAYLSAHLVQYRLHDYNLVLGLTREILADTRGAHWQDIELATLQLRSAALIGLRRAGTLRTSDADPDPVQSALLKTVQKADAMGYQFERAQAIQQSAHEYEAQSAFPMALEQFQRALEIADAIGAGVLAKGIRERVVRIHAGQGDDPSTNKVLQQIEARLVAAGGGDELALNLLQQGRIFSRSFHYPQAIEVLTQALGFENDSSIRTQINLELAKAHFETGQTSDALAFMQAAGVKRQQAVNFFAQGYQVDSAGPEALRHRDKAEKMYQDAKSLVRQEQRNAAINIMQELMDTVLDLRHSQRGVLGAWYWQRHAQLLESYLDLQMQHPSQDGGAARDALLALSKMRHSEMPVTDTKADFGILSKSSLHDFLAGLASDEALLTYHLTPSAAYVWLGRNGKIQQFRLANPRKLYGELQAARKSLAETGGVSLGPTAVTLSTALLGPVAHLLPQRVYLIPSGLLMGFPFDALRVNGSYLAEQHTIINLLSFPVNQDPHASLRWQPPQQVFLAGHPQAFSASFADRLETSAEIQAVTDIFMGPGLSIIQGAALLPDEFESELFAGADLVHLTMPVSIDFGHPERSGLALSEAIRGFGRTPFKQADIRALELHPQLVFLSAAHTVGAPRSSVSTPAGVASAFLEAGAASVIATLWAQQTHDDLVTGFYHNLEKTGDIAVSLTAAKRQKIQASQARQSIAWSRFQLFIH